MRNIIFGGIGVVWGGLVLAFSFLRKSDPQGDGSYAVGQTAGTVFGLLLFVAGLYYLVVGILSLTQEKPKKKKKKRIPRPGDED